MGFDPDRGESIEDFDAARCTALVRRAVGISELAVEVLSTMAWSPAARVAERYAKGRAFLVGDAAHEMTRRARSG